MKHNNNNNSQLINGQCKDTKFPFIGELSILDRCNFVYNIFSINDVLDDLVNSD